ncbi:unnamed protein product [Aphanomyces euteiches]|uniref:Uncharacterized protein n=1 Tax=Aphanomyces euteiches TaxID=100861 RepID=A0A6G0X992_9STRA|nr:hypothetical protein Ae201684_007532 [Aphanomyces euteiches]KAH9100568.1 hypothetical protein Ae201684P_006764 [Aphanomyces euteiches]KAH9103624.1 hypothetical protein AeMF1_020080 [Aphanomyces euteiches]KAH9132068.1 hypothetical protein AeRB84_021430 [Aphanomyces euteiches]
MLRPFVLATGVLAVASAQATNVDKDYVSQVLNARGGGALLYAGKNLNVDSLLQDHPECQSCTSNAPCGHRNIVDGAKCIAPSSRVMDGTSADYCLDVDVCCGGTCRNSMRQTKNCSFLGNAIKNAFAQANLKSATSMLAFIQSETSSTAAPSSQLSNLLQSLISDDTLSKRCSSNCNGWTWQGQTAPVVCPSSCGCTKQGLPTFVSGPLYQCELKVPNADSFFSSGDKKLTQDAKFGDLQGKVVCPKDYVCNNSTTCITYDTYAARAATVATSPADTSSAAASNSSPSASTSSSSSSVAIGVGCGVGGLVAIAGLVFWLTRTKKAEEAHDDYQELS